MLRTSLDVLPTALVGRSWTMAAPALQLLRIQQRAFQLAVVPHDGQPPDRDQWNQARTVYKASGGEWESDVHGSKTNSDAIKPQCDQEKPAWRHWLCAAGEEIKRIISQIRVPAVKCVAGEVIQGQSRKKGWSG